MAFSVSNKLRNIIRIAFADRVQADIFISALEAAGIDIDQNGMPVVSQAQKINFTGSGVSVTPDADPTQADVAITGGGGGSGITTYANQAALPPTAADGAAAITLDTDTLWIFNLGTTTWKKVGAPGVALSATGPITLVNNVIAIPVASGSANGYLASADWTTFNNKVPATRNVNTTAPLTGGGALSGDLTIAIPVATSLANGYLASTDWSTFNAKQPAGSYITALTGDVTAAGPGSSAATIAANAVTNAKLAQMAANTIKANNTGSPANASDITVAQLLTMIGVVPPTNGGAPPVTRNLYVDGTRTDSFTPDGSLARPFATIQAAINQIITNNDNATHPYTINVVPFAYGEALTFNSSTLHTICISANLSASTPLQNCSIASITSTSNNTQLAILEFNGFTISGATNLTGDTNGTNFGSTQILFSSCQFNGGNITLNNVNNVNFYNCQVQGATASTWTNVAFAYMNGAEGFIGGTTLHLVDNPGGNVPSQYLGNYLLFNQTKFYGTMTIDATSELDTLLSYFGSTSLVTNNGTMHTWGTDWAGTAVGALTLNNGSTYRNRGDIFFQPPVVNAGATIQNQSVPYMLAGVFGTSAVFATNAALVTKDGHQKSTQTTAPTTTINGNAGSGSSSSVSHATDNAGALSLTTGTSGWAAGIQTTINFNKTYNVAPIVLLTPTGANAANSTVSRGVYVASGTGSFTLNFATADTAQTTYTWNYLVIETQ